MTSKVSIGRVIVVPFEPLLEPIIQFYAKKSAFLVISYNADNFTPSKKYPCPLVAYHGIGKAAAAQWGLPDSVASNPGGNQWRAWPLAAKVFPEVPFWLIHDYDVICKPSDTEIERLVPAGHYGMIGQPLPRYLPGIPPKKFPTYTYPFNHLRYPDLWHVQHERVREMDENVMRVMTESYPVTYENVRTVLCGYGDLIAASRELLLHLEDPELSPITIGGVEQVIHGVAHRYGFSPVDLSRHFKTRVRLAPLLWFSETDEIFHSIKNIAVVTDRGKKWRWALRSYVIHVATKLLGEERIRRLKRFLV